MRLQISVKRYSLPSTNVIFTTRSFGPSPATSSSDATIAQLLEDINEIVPLESADWGLEDYAVEVNGYECLHFSPIDAVLRDGDQVVIRALKTQDLRSRRLGGRHQISSDGRHLIDGVAFGRQWLKKGGRPAVQIPPRKRRLQIKSAENHEEQDTGPLALTDVNDADELDDEDSDEDDDEDQDSDFVDEDGDVLTDDESDGETEPSFVIDTRPSLQIVARQDFQDADDEVQDSTEEEDSDEDLADSETADQEVLAAELQALREEERSQNANFGGKQQESVMRLSPSDGSDIRSSRRKRKLTVDHDIQDQYGPEFNGFSSPIIKRIKADEVPAPPDSDSDSTSSSGSDSDEDSDSGASSPPSKKPPCLDGSANSDHSSNSSEETSDSGSDSDSDAASEDESGGSSSPSSRTSDVIDSNGEAPSRTPPKRNALVSVPKSPEPSVVISSVTTRPSVPPGQGSKRTRYANQRQKKRYRLAALKEQGFLPENASFTDMAAYDEAQQTGSLGPAAAVAKVIEAKKQELLGQVQEQAQEEEKLPVPVQAPEQNPYMAWEPTDKIVRSSHSLPRRTQAPFTDDSSEQLQGLHTPLHERPVKDLVGSLLAPAVETKSDPPKQRSRLDLNSTRNMIFNGLGVRKPKNAAAEQALREKLAMPVKGALPKQLFKDASMKQDEGSTKLDDAQIPWQSKLIVSAVECEVEGVTLKEPPFPFVQGWDEGAIRRLRNIKKKGRNQRQYYAYDEDAAMDGYEEPDNAEDHDESMLYDEVNGVDTVDKLRRQTSNLINEAQDQLDTKASDLLSEDVQDLPWPDDVDSLDTLLQQDALPGAVIAFKEFHLNATSLQPEISGYRVARVEAVQEDGRLDLTLSKRDRKPSRVMRYDEETGERILSRSEMFQGSDEAGEDDGSRLLAYADLIEPKLVELSTASKPTTNRSLFAETEVPNGPSLSVSELAVFPESTVSDNPTWTSAQPPVQTVTVAETGNGFDIEIATPRRAEISALMKEAGFDSNLDSQLLRPINGRTDSAQRQDPDLDVTRESMNHSRKTSVEPVSEAQQTAPDTSGFDSPRFNGWSSSPPVEPEPDEAADESNIGELLDSSQQVEEQPDEEAVGNGSLAPKNVVAYPHISQLELDASMQGSSNTKLCEGKGDDSPVYDDSSLHNDQEGALYLDSSGIEAVEDTHLDSLRSMIPPSVEQSQDAVEPPARDAHVATATFLGGPDGQISSDDDELPSLARITSTARSRSSRLSPQPVTRQGKRKATHRRKLTSPFDESIAPGSQPPVKQSQSQIRLSQIPPGSHVVDLTFSSDPVSPGNSDGDYAKTKRLSRRSNKGKTVTDGAGAEKSDALAVSAGLGNRRLLKSKKAKS